MDEQTSLDNFVVEYKKLLEEVTALRKQQIQHLHLFQNLMKWLVHTSQSVEHLNELTLLTDRFYLNNRDSFHEHSDARAFWQDLSELVGAKYKELESKQHSNISD
ncbi:hypothetical protein QG082_04440 [Kingella kingae]|uniref:hypothetical protein n=1 Tax=Kingella kingae TaxID=504 RepID=UPI00056E9D43|nr:hypothetical protein [Kingella kingae]MDK4528167.1 hypothetical protein [Kingella kingae]MDK4542751.1 hypothetical protein [Kingella kingae]MDK4562218.1 hypothetical protein [Kingella kingae]MDK4592934.1 hypothetical protein [Kingella kingae]MDK4596432.1 hypothetical protein [Kingella kingae]